MLKAGRDTHFAMPLTFTGEMLFWFFPACSREAPESGKKHGLHTVRRNLARPAHLGTLSLKSMTQVFPA